MTETLCQEDDGAEMMILWISAFNYAVVLAGLTKVYPSIYRCHLLADRPTFLIMLCMHFAPSSLRSGGEGPARALNAILGKVVNLTSEAQTLSIAACGSSRRQPEQSQLQRGPPKLEMEGAPTRHHPKQAPSGPATLL